MTQTRKSFENIVGKAEDADNRYFLLSTQSFLLYQRQIKTFD